MKPIFALAAVLAMALAAATLTAGCEGCDKKTENQRPPAYLGTNVVEPTAVAPPAAAPPPQAKARTDGGPGGAAAAAAAPDGAAPDAAAAPDAGPPPLTQAEFDQVAAGIKPALEQCARAVLSGNVSLQITIDPSGSVSRATAGGAPAGVGPCMEGVARGMSFRAFGGTPVGMTIPLRW